MTDTAIETPAKPVRKRKAKAEPANTEPPIGHITVVRPKNCNREWLSIDALDSNSRNLALNTFIYATDGMLPCRSFKHTDKGTLIIEVVADHFTLTNQSK